MTHLQHNYNENFEISVHNQVHFFLHVNNNTGNQFLAILQYKRQWSQVQLMPAAIDQRAKGWKKTTGKSLIKGKYQKKLTIFKGDSKLASDVQSWSLRKAKWKGNLMSFNCCKTFNKHFPKRILHVTRWQILPHSLPHHPQQKNILTQRLLITSSQIWPFHPRYNQWGAPP